MKYLHIAFLLILIPVISFAQTRSIISEGSYNMGDAETPTVAESRALLNAKRAALEQAGTYVESYSKTINYQLTEDEVKVIASGLMEVNVLEKKRTIVGDGLHFWVKIEARINPEKMETMAARVKEKSIIEDYKKIQKEYEKSRKEIALLKRQLLAAKKEKDKKKIETLIESDERSFQANEWFEKGSVYNLNYEHDKAIEAYTNAILLNPNYAEAYERRGIAYFNKGNLEQDQHLFDQAVQDLKRVTLLKPNTHAAFWAQGIVDISSKRYDKAIESFNKAVALDPNSELGYLGRGVTYYAMKQPDRALEEYTKAIATKGFWQAISYMNRAGVYIQKGQRDMAIRDMDQAIALAPNNAHFYYMRGLLYELMNKTDRAVVDLERACTMGNNNGCGWLKKVQEHAYASNRLLFLEGDWSCNFVGVSAQYQVHYTVQGTQVEERGSTNFVAIYNAELNGDNLIFSGRSTSNPEYGEIVDMIKVLNNRTIQKYANRFGGVEHSVNIVCNKR